jgi:hypothetical protein
MQHNASITHKDEIGLHWFSVTWLTAQITDTSVTTDLGKTYNFDVSRFNAETRKTVTKYKEKYYTLCSVTSVRKVTLQYKVSICNKVKPWRVRSRKEHL